MVREVKINSEGSLLLTTSSDGTIKLWDIGEQKCVKTYKHHQTDGSSCWAISVHPSFKFFFSGSREGVIYHVSTLTAQANKIADFGKLFKILTLEYSASDDTLWVGSTSSEVIGLK